jgi:hypothetical protein
MSTASPPMTPPAIAAVLVRGTTVPSMELGLVDDSDAVPPGAGVMPGFWEDDDATPAGVSVGVDAVSLGTEVEDSDDEEFEGTDTVFPPSSGLDEVGEACEPLVLVGDEAKGGVRDIEQPVSSSSESCSHPPGGVRDDPGW